MPTLVSKYHSHLKGIKASLRNGDSRARAGMIPDEPGTYYCVRSKKVFTECKNMSKDTSHLEGVPSAKPEIIMSIKINDNNEE